MVNLTNSNSREKKNEKEIKDTSPADSLKFNFI